MLKADTKWGLMASHLRSMGLTWRIHWSITIKRSAKWGMHSHLTVAYVIWAEAQGVMGTLLGLLVSIPDWEQGAHGSAGTCDKQNYFSCFSSSSENMQWVSTGGKPTTVMFVPWGKQLLFIPVAPKEVRHACNQQGKEQAEDPVGAGVSGHSHIPGHSCWAWLCPFTHHPACIFDNTPVSLLLVISALCPLFIMVPCAVSA